MGINLSLWMPELSFYQTNFESVWIGMLGRVSPRVSIWIRSCSICSCICCIICCIASCFHSSICRKSSPISLLVTTSNIFKKNMPTHTHQTWGNNGNTNTQLHAISALTTPIEPLGRHLSRQLGPVARNPREPAKPVAECSWIRGSSRFTQPLRSFHFFRHSGLASGSTRQFS